MIRLLGDSRGSTLIDNILAIAVISFGLVSGLTVLQNASLNSIYGDRSTIATQIATESMEEVIADANFVGYEQLGNEDYVLSELQDGYNGFTRTVAISEVNANDLVTAEQGSGVKKVSVTVSWGDQGYESVTVSTVVAELNADIDNDG